MLLHIPSEARRTERGNGGADEWSPTRAQRALLFDAERLAALHEAALLDVPPPDDLQRLTRVLARQLHAPMATLTVIDADRQYFLASTGLPERLATARQTALSGAICTHALFDNAPLVVADVSKAPGFSESDAVELTGMGCYLGAPITTADGTRIGALCVMAREARAWSAEDVAVVEDFASLAAELIEARLLRARVMYERKEKLDILTRITEGFVTLDRAWRVKFVNAMAAALARCTPAEAEGRTLWELLPPLESSDMGRWLREIQEEPGIYEREWKGLVDPGWFEMRAVVSHDGTSLYVRDITSRKHAEQALIQSEARYRELTYVAPVGIFECDTAGACTYLNQRALELMGVELQQALGDGWAMAVHPDDREFVISEWRASLTGAREYWVEFRLARPDGRQRWVVARATPAHGASGEVTGFIGTVADITEIKSAEDELRRLNQRFEHALAGSDIGLWDWDVASGRVLCSDRIATMLGYRADEISGDMDTLSTRVHPDDFDGVTRLLTDHLDGRTPFYRSTHRRRTKDGGWRWILDAGAVVERDARGHAVRVIGTHVDVSESKDAEERFRLLFERSTVPNLLINEHGVIDCNNATVSALRCRSKRSIVGRPLQEFLPRLQPGGRSSRKALVAAVRQAMEHGSHRFECMLCRADTSEFPLEITLSRVTFEGRCVLLATWHDLTQQREQEHVLRAAAAAAEAASRAKSDFLARMSHELRSPLNSVIGFSNLLRRNRTGALSPTDTTYLDRIHANGVHLLSVINDILDIARIEAGRDEVERAEVDLVGLVRGVVQQLEGQLSADSVRLRIVLPANACVIATDEQKLRQVLINLVGNAIKFTAAGEVVATLEVDAHGAARAIEVRDTGVGIPPALLPVIFDPFEQAETGTSRRFEGTGLGLAISKQLCELMGYALSATSDVGRGSVFRVALTGAAVAAGAPAA